MPTLLLGVGSPFADDQVGWLISDLIAQAMSGDSNFVIYKSDRPGLNLLQVLANNSYKRIVIIDAMQAGYELYTVKYFKAVDIIAFEGLISSHALGVSQSLALTQALGINIDRVTVFGIEIGQIEVGYSISPALQTLIPDITRQIIKQISNRHRSHMDRMFKYFDEPSGKE